MTPRNAHLIPTPQTDAIALLAKLPEDELQSKIIEPLFRALGFTDVRTMAGPIERGKDLIAIKEDLGRPLIYAVQIKKFRFSGSSQHDRSVQRVLDQLRQAMTEPAIDPTILRKRKVDRCVFITPYPIDVFALENALEQLHEARLNQIEIIDGPRLYDLVQKHIPEALYALGDIDFRYRQRAASDVGYIAESVAFGMRNGLMLSDIYVGVQIAYRGTTQIADILKYGPRAQHMAHIVATFSQQLISLKRACKSLAGIEPDTWEPPRLDYRRVFPLSSAKYVGYLNKNLRMPPSLIRELESHGLHLTAPINVRPEPERQMWHFQGAKPTDQLAIQQHSHHGQSTLTVVRGYEAAEARQIRDDIDPRWKHEQMIVEIDMGEVAQRVHTRIREVVQSLKKLELPGIEVSESNSICLSLLQLENDMDVLCGDELIQRHWHDFADRSAGHSEDVDSLSQIGAATLLNVTVPLFIRGGPGSGKTTLIRWLAHSTALQSVKQMPIVLYLIRCPAKSVKAFVEACHKEIERLGVVVKGEEFHKRLTDGTYRIFFDGLDERGLDAKITLEAIRRFASAFPKAGVVVSCRDGFVFPPWKDALSIRLSPFDDEQQRTFIWQWFKAEPSYRATLLCWLEKNPTMRSASRTPLVLALLCSLYEVGAEMPESEIQLYGRRFQLLVGEWERAKGIEPLEKAMRDRYMHYVMNLGFELHTAKVRSCDPAIVRELATRFYNRAFHVRPDALVDDCVKRGLLLIENDGRLSFGHLTYQEYLVGRYLDWKNDIQTIWSFLTNSWWLNALKFFSLLRCDVGDLFVFALSRTELTDVEWNVLMQLLPHAPLTDGAVVAKCALKWRKAV